MQVNGIIDRFSVQSILMLSHLQIPETEGRQDKRRKEPESAGFNSILAKQMITAKTAAY
ncbi:MAG: hypothetical protein LBV33_02430 [Lachnospiraceae bacterium]|jgi:hypothetical protein|nr:hypothetical protein [Lachnospiraceae bacterium]